MHRIRRRFDLALSILALGFLSAIAGACSNAAADTPTIHVFKTATCGCCKNWVAHLEAAGFDVDVKDLPDLASVKNENGVPAELTSCHTAIVDGYVIEGHVPASDIERLLSDRPTVKGLAVPDMPPGSPGMELPDPSRHQPYDVMSFGPDGVQVFATHRPS